MISRLSKITTRSRLDPEHSTPGAAGGRQHGPGALRHRRLSARHGGPGRERGRQHPPHRAVAVGLPGRLALGQLLFGPLSDRIGRKPVLLGGLVVFLLASLAITTVGSLSELLAWRFVQALGGGATVVNSAAIVRDCFSGREAARVMSTMAIIMLLAPLVAPVVGSGLLYLGEWWLIFIFLAAYAAFLMWLLGTRLPETRAPGSPTASLRQVLSNYASVL